MGSFVDKFSDTPFEWGNEQWSGLGSETAKDLVTTKVNSSLSVTTQLLEKLLGEDGNSGYLGEMYATLQGYTAPTIPDHSLDEGAISLAFSFLESTYNEDLFTDLLAKIIADLQDGATGLDPDVEAAIYARAQSRQAVEEDKIQEEIEDYFAATGFDLPPLALSARLQEHANGRAMRTLDMNQKIAIDQAELAQKNGQFILGAATQLEGILRTFHNSKNDRELEKAKTTVNVTAEELKLKIDNKRLLLENAIATADGIIRAFEAEAKVRTEIISEMGRMSSQGLASALGSVNANVGLSHSTGRSQSEGFTHSESRSIGFDKNNSLSESHQFEEEA